jgi:CBS domain-containing protein
MKVESLMTKAVLTCRSTDRLDRAASIMWEADVGCVPVLDEASRVAGMITDRDVCMAAYTQGLPLAAIPVATAMSRQVAWCKATDEVAVARRLLTKHRVRRLPVLGQDGALVGILTLSDLAREAARQRDREVREVGPDDVVGTLAAVSEPRRGAGARESGTPALGQRAAPAGGRRGAGRRAPPTDSAALEQLLDRIQCGTIDDVEELEARDLDLLRRFCGNDEEVQSLIDRLRGTQREEG